MSDKVLTENELYELAWQAVENPAHTIHPGPMKIESCEEALKILAGDESYIDNSVGNVSEWPFMYVTRVANWLLVEDDQGFAEAQEFDTCEQANKILEAQSMIWQQEEALAPRFANELQEGDYVKAFKKDQLIGTGRVFYEGEPGVIRIRALHVDLRIERSDHDWSFQMTEPQEANA